MSLLKKLFKKKETVQETSSLIEDLEKAAHWAAENLTASGYLADYSLDSLKDLDRFFEAERDGLLAEHEDRGVVLFTLGAYLGQTVLNNYGGSWKADDKEPQAELYVTLVLPNGRAFQPVQAAISRYQYVKSQPFHIFVNKLGQVVASPETEQAATEPVAHSEDDHQDQ